MNRNAAKHLDPKESRLADVALFARATASSIHRLASALQRPADPR